jgi:natural product biosynthesis luciferase-like monooxygenase protein
MLMASTNGQEHRAEIYRVLQNGGGRYGLWPVERAVPPGWREVLRGRKPDCTEYVRRAWPELFARESRQARARIEFGLMFFGGGESEHALEKYRLVIECARFADQRGFAAVWLPERHFTRLGCLYPNPAVLCAALARETRRIRLRAGSVVLPLHHPVRVAEEWSVVDNLSNGRVEISFAPGWNPEDFVLAPAAYEDRHEAMFTAIETIERLWTGQPLKSQAGDGSWVEVRTAPRPIQPRLPKWVTAAANPATFRRAGETGAHLFTHLFDLSVDRLAEMIALYRGAREQSGLEPQGGRVAVAMHTFLADDLDAVRRHSYRPFCDYLKSNAGLVAKLALSRGMTVDVSKLTERQLDEAVDLLFEKFLNGRSLLGTPETCASQVEQLVKIGVNEVACLLDFGPEPDAILGELNTLDRLRRRFAEPDLLAQAAVTAVPPAPK